VFSGHPLHTAAPRPLRQLHGGPRDPCDKGYTRGIGSEIHHIADQETLRFRRVVRRRADAAGDEIEQAPTDQLILTLGIDHQAGRQMVSYADIERLSTLLADTGKFDIALRNTGSTATPTVSKPATYLAPAM
jgi:hypothetical protein